jgi:hypothetical protein
VDWSFTWREVLCVSLFFAGLILGLSKDIKAFIGRIRKVEFQRKETKIKIDTYDPNRVKDIEEKSK